MAEYAINLVNLAIGAVATGAAAAAVIYGLDRLDKYRSSRRTREDMNRRGWQMRFDFDRRGSVVFAREPLDEYPMDI